MNRYSPYQSQHFYNNAAQPRYYNRRKSYGFRNPFSSARQKRDCNYSNPFIRVKHEIKQESLNDRSLDRSDCLSWTISEPRYSTYQADLHDLKKEILINSEKAIQEVEKKVDDDAARINKATTVSGRQGSDPETEENGRNANDSPDSSAPQLSNECDANLEPKKTGQPVSESSPEVTTSVADSITSDKNDGKSEMSDGTITDSASETGSDTVSSMVDSSQETMTRKDCGNVVAQIERLGDEKDGCNDGKSTSDVSVDKRLIVSDNRLPEDKNLGDVPNVDEEDSINELAIKRGLPVRLKRRVTDNKISVHDMKRVKTETNERIRRTCRKVQNVNLSEIHITEPKLLLELCKIFSEEKSKFVQMSVEDLLEFILKKYKEEFREKNKYINQLETRLRFVAGNQKAMKIRCQQLFAHIEDFDVATDCLRLNQTPCNNKSVVPNVKVEQSVPANVDTPVDPKLHLLKPVCVVEKLKIVPKVTAIEIKQEVEYPEEARLKTKRDPRKVKFMGDVAIHNIADPYLPTLKTQPVDVESINKKSWVSMTEEEILEKAALKLPQLSIFPVSYADRNMLIASKDIESELPDTTPVQPANKSTPNRPSPYPRLPHTPRRINTLGKLPPPTPQVTYSKNTMGGITLMWTIEMDSKHEKIETFEIFYCRDNRKTLSNSMTLWKKMVEIKFISQKMSCTMTEFTQGMNYYLAVRAVDAFNKSGEFSEPIHIYL